MTEHDNSSMQDKGLYADLAERQDPAQFQGWQRKVAFFLSGQTISMFGSMLVQFAIIWHITLTTESGWMLTISTLFGFVPQLLVSLFAGVWADRYNRRYLIIGADVLIAVSTLILALLFAAGYDDIWLLFVVSAVRSFGSGIQAPAVGALLPQIVPQQSLMRINGLNGSIQSVIMLLSPAVSAAILASWNIVGVFYIDVATALIAVVIMFMLKVPLHHKATQAQTTGYLDDLKEGLNYTRSDRVISRMLVFYAGFFFFVVPVAFLTPLMIARTFATPEWLAIFQDEYWLLMANEIAFSSASVIGGILIAIWGGFKNRIFSISFACVLFGITTFGLGLASNFYVFLVIVFLAGIGMPIFNTAATVIFQERVPGDMQGRVFSLLQIVITSSFPLGMLIWGPLSDVVSVESLLIVSGIAMAAIGLYIYRNKELQAAGYAPKHGEAATPALSSAG